MLFYLQGQRCSTWQEVNPFTRCLHVFPAEAAWLRLLSPLSTTESPRSLLATVSLALSLALYPQRPLKSQEKKFRNKTKLHPAVACGCSCLSECAALFSPSDSTALLFSSGADPSWLFNCRGFSGFSEAPWPSLCYGLRRTKCLQKSCSAVATVPPSTFWKEYTHSLLVRGSFHDALLPRLSCKVLPHSCNHFPLTEVRTGIVLCMSDGFYADGGHVYKGGWAAGKPHGQGRCVVVLLHLPDYCANTTFLVILVASTFEQKRDSCIFLQLVIQQKFFSFL